MFVRVRQVVAVAGLLAQHPDQKARVIGGDSRVLHGLPVERTFDPVPSLLQFRVEELEVLVHGLGPEADCPLAGHIVEHLTAIGVAAQIRTPSAALERELLVRHMIGFRHRHDRGTAIGVEADEARRVERGNAGYGL